MVKDFAEEQEKCGAFVLDVNMGMSGINEKETMLCAMEEISTVSNLPLSLDSSHIDVLEEALRRYPGRALVNSVSYEKEKFEKLLPVVKKYGAMFILLPLSDAGLPADLSEKKEIICKIWERAQSLGFTKEDIVVDGLVTTVGANPKAALETLETIRKELCPEKPEQLRSAIIEKPKKHLNKPMPQWAKMLIAIAAAFAAILIMALLKNSF